MARGGGTLYVADAEDRVRAVVLMDQNVLVHAGAGTGKTALLTARLGYSLLHQMYQGRQRGMERPEEEAIRRVVAITFTEKAAAEMQLRLRHYFRHWLGTATEQRLDDAFVDRIGLEFRQRHELDMAQWRTMVTALARRLSDVQVSTIHSFCAGLLRRFPFEAKVPVNFQIDEAGEALDRIFRDLWYRYFRRLIGTGAGNPPRLLRAQNAYRRLLRKFDLDEPRVRQVAAFLGRLYITYGRAFEEHQVRAESRLDTAYFRRLQEVGFLAAFADALDAAAGSARDEAKTFLYQALARVIRESDEVGQIRAGIRRLRRKYWRFRDFYSSLFGSGASRDLRELWNRAREWLPEARVDTFPRILKDWLGHVDATLMPDLMQALEPFLRRLLKEYRAQGFLSFEDLLVRARDLLLRDRGVRARVFRELEHLLVDEFQDTNRIQIEILSLLIRDPESQEWVPGRLFVVGDPKQSIYAFREADLAAFQEFREALARSGTLVEMVLRSNFRSRDEVLAAVNEIGPVLFRSGREEMTRAGETDERFRWSVDDDNTAPWLVLPGRFVQPQYQPIEAVRVREKLDWDPGTPRFVCFGSWGNGHREDRDMALAAYVAEVVRGWATSREGAPRWQGTAVLFRKLTDFRFLQALVEAFQERSIPYVIEGDRRYFQKPEVIDASNLLKVLVDPWDRAALLGLWRSPAFGFSDAFLVDLFQYERGLHRGIWKSHNNPAPVLIQTHSLEPWCNLRDTFLEHAAQHRDEYDQAIEQVRWIIGLRDRITREVVPRAVQHVLLVAPFLAAYGTRLDGPQRAMNLAKLLELAYRWSDQGYDTLDRFVDRLLRAVVRGEEESEKFLADPDINACQWMTIHKAKGLEFDLVLVVQGEFLVEPERGRDPRATYVELGVDRANRVGISVHMGGRRGRIANTVEPFRRLLHGQVEKAEKARLFYVAMTRAREHFEVLCRCRPRKKTDETCTTWAWLARDGALARLQFYAPREPGELPVPSGPRPAPQVPDRILQLPKRYPNHWRRQHRDWLAFGRQRPYILHPSEFDRYELPVGVVLEMEGTAPEQVLAPPVARAGDEQAAYSRFLGSLIHELLFRLPVTATSDVKADLAWVRRVLEQPPAWLARFTTDANSHRWDSARTEARDLLEAFLSSEVWARIRAGLLAREWPILWLPPAPASGARVEPAGLWEGRVDVVFWERQPDGTECIVVGDYKTDREADQALLLQRYGDQLRIYREAVATVMPQVPVFAELILLRSGRRLRWHPAARRS